MPKKIDFELKVGMFVFVGVVILTIIVFSISDFKAMSSGYYLKVLFNFANGIEVGAPVRLAGVKAGEVKDIQITYADKFSPEVEILIWVEKKNQVHADSIAHINTLGLLGEKYLEIMPGSKESPVLKEGDSLKGRDSVSMAQVSEMGYQIALKLDKVIASLYDVLGDPEIKTALKETLKNSQKLTGDADGLVQELRANPWKLLYKPREKKLK
ncbi:MAG: MlaD family protein [Candidatus Omnitrophica bacterium]|nr:MlaD family protein [Candidatus Omnitrophota bacterium]